jgi:hypothetical protein
MSDNDKTTYSEYREEVNTIAEDIAERMRSGEVTDQSDAVHEACDSHSWVIYTHYNFAILLHCSNHDAYTEEYGEAPTDSSGNLNWAVLAYAALAEDVNDALSRLDTDLADDDDDEGDDDEDNQTKA